MNRVTPGAILASLTFAAAMASSSLRAQECLFQTIPAQPPTTFSSWSPVRVVYDTVRGRLLLMESTSGEPTRLYTWTGSAWLLISNNGPPSRLESAIAFDGARDRLVLFGGGGNGYPTDTWEWDGAAWSTTTPAVSPSGRYGHAMVFDSFRSRVVMFGGFISNQYPDDTWTWDGSTWTLQPPGTLHPAGRYLHSMTYDSARGHVMMFGGLRNSSSLPDVWEWTGVWAQLPYGPGARYRTGLCYDPLRDRVTLMGGSGPNREVWEFNPSAAQWSLVVAFVSNITGDSTLTFNGALGRPVLSLGTGLRVWNGDAANYAPEFMQQPTFGGAYCPGSGAAISASPAGYGPFTYRWHHNGQAMVDGGNISGVASNVLVINPVTFADAGSYTVVATNPCGTATSTATTLSVAIAGCTPAPCYANCDASLTPPLLTANDFMCFLSAFVAGHSYANCDGSSIQPLLTGNDFQCFLDKYVAGCP